MFALVAVSILSVTVVGLTSAAGGGFLAARSVDATAVGTNTPALTTKAALSSAIEAVRSNPDTGYRSFWSSDTRSVASARCFGATDSTTGANYLDYRTETGDIVRVYCAPVTVPGAASSTNPFVQATDQPDLTDGLVLLHRSTAPALKVSGAGTFLVQGRVRVNGAITFPGRSVNCPQADASTTFVSTVACPTLQVTPVNAGDGSGGVTATACDPTAITAADGVLCNASQVATAPSVPARAPSTFGTAIPAIAPWDIACTGSRATLSPGLYSETATSGITSLLNALTGASPASCVVQATTLYSKANVGSTLLTVNEKKGFRPGDRITVGGPSGENMTITSTYVMGTGRGTLNLASPTTKQWSSGSSVTGGSCVKGSGSPCTSTGGTTITTLLLAPGTYFFDLSANWVVNNSAVTVIGGTEDLGGSATVGDLCVPPTDASGAPGVVLAFDGGNSLGGSSVNGPGLVVSAGTVSLCAGPAASATDRPVAVYGPTGALSGTYRKVGTSINTNYTFKARGTTCATGATTICNLVSVGAGGHLYLYGAVYAPNDDVALAVGPYDDDQLLLHGVVADALNVTTTQVTTTDASRVRPVCGNPRKAGSVLDVAFTAYRCSGTCPDVEPSTGQVGAASVTFTPVTVSGAVTRSADLHGPLSGFPFWSVTG